MPHNTQYTDATTSYDTLESRVGRAPATWRWSGKRVGARVLAPKLPARAPA